MRKIKSLLMATVVATMLGSCADEGTTPVYNNVLVHSRTYNHQNAYQASDSRQITGIGPITTLRVTNARVLISRMQLHVDAQPEGVDNRLVSEGPFVFRGYESSTTLIAEAQLTTNLYDNVKFEIHRFEPNELSVYANDTAFAVFATPERYTVVINGLLNDSIPFTYYSNITANLTLPFDSAITVNDVRVAHIELQFNALTAFTQEGIILDPRLETNRIVINNQLRLAFRAAKM